MKNDKIGYVFVILGTVIGIAGTVANNVFLDHNLAMRIWRWSNIFLMVFFVGLWRKWWNSTVGAGVMCVLYGFYIITNEWGLDLA